MAVVGMGCRTKDPHRTPGYMGRAVRGLGGKGMGVRALRGNGG